MSLLPRAVKFRPLAKQLTDTEFNVFISKLTKLYGKEIIFSSLFNSFAPSLQSNMNDDIYIYIISNIIESRKIKDKQKPKPSKIDELPSPLIAEIGSYVK